MRCVNLQGTLCRFILQHLFHILQRVNGLYRRVFSTFTTYKEYEPIIN